MSWIHISLNTCNYFSVRKSAIIKKKNLRRKTRLLRRACNNLPLALSKFLLFPLSEITVLQHENPWITFQKPEVKFWGDSFSFLIWTFTKREMPKSILSFKISDSLRVFYFVVMKISHFFTNLTLLVCSIWLRNLKKKFSFPYMWCCCNYQCLSFISTIVRCPTDFTRITYVRNIKCLHLLL